LVCLDLGKEQRNKKIGNSDKITQLGRLGKFGKLGVSEKMG
jgi:hypothetical protein